MYMGMGCPTVAVRMLSSYVSGAARIKGLHLQKSEGVRPVNPSATPNHAYHAQSCMCWPSIHGGI